MAKGNSRNSSGESHRISTSGDIEVSTYLEIAKEMAGEQPAAATEAVSGAEREAEGALRAQHRAVDIAVVGCVDGTAPGSGHLGIGRVRSRRELAREDDTEADIVIPVPDSANTAALGYAEASGIRFEIGLIRNHYVGRTFIKPDQHERDVDVLVQALGEISGTPRAFRDRVIAATHRATSRGSAIKQAPKRPFCTRSPTRRM
mgnify:CR=1 FL=1